MAVIAVLGALCALCATAVLVLVIAVARLSAQVRRLSGDLSSLASRTEPSDAPSTAAAHAPAPAPPEIAERVPVITVLPDADDGLDITARRVASVTLARPLIKVASLSYGLRRALDDEHRFKVRYVMRQEFRRQRKMRRRRRAGRAPSMGWRS